MAHDSLHLIQAKLGDRRFILVGNRESDLHCVPWPNPEVFQTGPWKEELLDSLLGNDLPGLDLRYHGKNFLDTVDRTFEAKVDYGWNWHPCRRTGFRSCPGNPDRIGILSYRCCEIA